MQTIVLTKCTLRPFQSSDAASLSQQANNIKIWNQVRDLFPHPYTLEDGQKWIKFIQSAGNPDFQLGIIVDGLAVGGIGLIKKEVNYKHSGELGYWLGEEYWGKGILSEVIPAVLNYGFTALQLQRIFACCFEGNLASRRVLEKSGFQFEGTSRKGVIKNDQMIDEWRFGILAEDFLRK